jgi:hypothetical protein
MPAVPVVAPSARRIDSTNARPTRGFCAIYLAVGVVNPVRGRIVADSTSATSPRARSRSSQGVSVMA